MTDKPLFASDAERTVETARLNDLARTAPKTVNATWLATGGVAALIAEAVNGEDRGVELATRLARFTDFDEGDDPYGERDFGAFELWASACFGRSTTITRSVTSTRRSSGAPSSPGAL